MNRFLSTAIFCAFLLLRFRSTSVAQTADLYYDVRFSLTSHENVGDTNNARIITRRIITKDVVFGLLTASGFQASELDGARLLWRYSSDSTNSGMVIRVGTNEVNVSQYLQITYPQADDYVAVSSRVNGKITGDERIMRITCSGGLSFFDIQGFARARYGNDSQTRVRANLAGGGRITKPDGIVRDGVLEGTYAFFGPIR